METESFRERNRRRRAHNAFERLREYALTHGVPDPDAAAREAVEQLHSAEATAGRAEQQQPTGRRAAGRSTYPPAAGKSRVGRAATKAETGTGAVAEPRSREENGGEAKGGTRAKAAPTPTPAATEVPQAADKDNSAVVPRRLEDRTKEQLYARAQELEIEGRSQMTKDELIAAIRSKQ